MRDVLELRTAWQDTLLDVLQIAPRPTPVTVSSATAWRWSWGGRALGLVPDAFVTWLRVSPPLLSEVRSVCRGDLHLDDPLLDGFDHPLATFRGDVPVLRVPLVWAPRRVGADGIVDLDGEGDGCTRDGPDVIIPLSQDDAVVFDAGDLSVQCRRVRPERGVGGAPVDEDLVARTAAVAAAFAIGLTATAAVSLTPTTTVLEPDDVTPIRRIVMPDTPPPPPPSKTSKVPDGSRGGSGAAPRGPSSGRSSGGGNAVDQLTAGFDTLLDGLGGIDSDLVGTVGKLRAGFGGPGGPPRGGLGERRLGGGGTADGLGDWPGDGTGPGIGPGDGEGFGPRGPGDGPQGAPDDPITMDGLPKHLIDKVIKRHMPMIRYCYQRRLAARPDLGGKAVVRFVIARDGTVAKATIARSQLDDDEAEACLVDKVHKMRFPEPKGGGIVVVNYPFAFGVR